MAGAARQAAERHAAGLAARTLRSFFVDRWHRIDVDADLERAARAGYDYRPLIAYAVGALCLVGLEYGGPAYAYGEWLELLLNAGIGPTRLLHELRDGPFYELGTLAFWSGWRLLAYLAVPALIVRAAFKAPLSAYGLRVAGLREHVKLYVALLGVALIAILVASGQRSFQDHYPFYRLAARSWFDLAAWELLYATQFFALEFFFRGFLLEACRERFGSQAIFVMLAPYCMVHFGKPWPEAVAALPAGLVLGTLALSTRSIAGGVLLHVGVAWSMDLISLGRQGVWPTQLWP